MEITKAEALRILTRTVSNRVDELRREPLERDQVAETARFFAAQYAFQAKNPEGYGHMRNCHSFITKKIYAQLFGCTGHAIKYHLK
jgi:hypothetical protein